jgi:alkanesulfonate monooxygenase SsuD/methylene tetrahydromethanopterin reductase-like flavin-dependent oxidoreductase (luciferase family)
MTGMTTLGAVFTPFNPPERLRSVARTADEAGLEQLWLWEDCFREAGISTLTAALAWTENLRVGIGVLPFPLRNVALTAMEVASIERMFPGRAIIGVGHGVQNWMEQLGVRADSPLTLMREYTVALRSLLIGEHVTVDGRYVHLDDVALDWPPAVAPAIHAAATGPKTLRLAGEVADGTVLSGGTTPDGVRAAVAHINAGRAERTTIHEVTVYLPVATGPDAAERLAAQAEYFGDDEDAFSVAGDAPKIADAVTQFAEAGATAVILQPPADEPDPESFVRWVAEQIRPRVS